MAANRVSLGRILFISGILLIALGCISLIVLATKNPSSPAWFITFFVSLIAGTICCCCAGGGNSVRAANPSQYVHAGGEDVLALGGRNFTPRPMRRLDIPQWPVGELTLADFGEENAAEATP